MAIMEYDITIIYLKGEDNHVADYFSRTEFNAILLNEGLLEEVNFINFLIVKKKMSSEMVISTSFTEVNDECLFLRC
uniref:Uncharacterized protein n=1 Tax=Strongyloides venezuelensis TaxID=75913 RepID=A0A0K0FCU9_STRVS